MKKEKNTNKRNYTLWLSNFLIGVSLVGFVFIFYPFISSYFTKPDLSNIGHETAIYIPKINAYSPIIYDVDPFNKNEYLDALKKGVAQAKGTAHVNEPGMMFLFAHSSGNPFEITHSNTPFLRLFEVNIGDKFYVYDNNQKYTYTIVDKKIINPSQVNYLLDSKADEVILQTCYPVGTDFQRLLVFAKQDNTHNNNL